MGAETKIEWTRGDDGTPGATWNPTVGCTKVSPGCDHCYAERVTERFHGKGSFATVQLHPDRLDLPLRWRRPRKVFVNSMSDLFHDDVPDGFIAQVWNVMAQCSQHTFQILTKRHARMRSWVTRWADRTGDHAADEPNGMPPMPRGPDAVRATYTSGRALLFADMLESMGTPPEGCAYPLYDWMDGQRFWPTVLPNVWLGVSVETQQWADIRIPALLDTPAAVRFLSCEPLLGPVDLGKYLHPGCHSDSDGDCSWRGFPQIRDGEPAASGRHCPFDRWADYDDDWELPLRPNSIDWCIVGGESGSGARPMHPQWARDLRDQCVAAGVPFLFKQWGQSRPLQAGDAFPDRRIVSVDRDQSGYPSFQLSIGKKAAGRDLDGRTWDEYPKIGGAT